MTVGHPIDWGLGGACCWKKLDAKQNIS